MQNDTVCPKRKKKKTATSLIPHQIENIKILNPKPTNPALSSLTHEPNHCLPNPYEPRPPHQLCNLQSAPCIVNPDDSKSTPRRQQWQQQKQPRQQLVSLFLFSMALFLSLSLDFSCHCQIGILGFLLGLLGLLLFGFVKVFVLLFYFFFFGILLLNAQNVWGFC